MTHVQPKHLPIMKSAYTVLTSVLYGGKTFASGAQIQLTADEAAPFIANGSLELSTG